MVSLWFMFLKIGMVKMLVSDMKIKHENILREATSFALQWENSLHLQNLFITKTCLYNFDLLKSHFYIVKLGFKGYTLFFLFPLKNIDCGYSLEPWF